MATKVTILEFATRPISIGEWFLCDGELLYLVQAAGGCVCLINLDSGNRQREHVQVCDVKDISENEFSRIKKQQKLTRVNVEILVSSAS
jgi:hypothetical protein